MIKNIALTIISVFIFYSSAYSGFSCDEKEIVEINKKVNVIYNAVPYIDPLKTEVNENEKLNAYYKDGSLLEVEIVINSPSKKQKQEYYFEKGFLILVIEKNYDVNDNEMNESIEIIHYYFKDNKMICWLNNDLTAAPLDDAYNTMEKMWLNNTDKYLLMIQ
jgi:hypothetical protein